MTKEEFYNALVNIYVKCGQGVEYDLLEKYSNLINELQQENKVKITRGKHFGKWVCLTEVYCPEENMDKDLLTLHYMRYYIGLRELDCFFGYNSIHELENDQNFQKRYNEWKEINAEALLKTNELIAKFR